MLSIISRLTTRAIPVAIAGALFALGVAGCNNSRELEGQIDPGGASGDPSVIDPFAESDPVPNDLGGPADAADEDKLKSLKGGSDALGAS